VTPTDDELRALIEAAKMAAARYRERPIDIYDRPESWRRLAELLHSIDALAAWEASRAD
jgi:hypothetical protein